MIPTKNYQDLKVEDVMTAQPISLQEDAHLSEAMDLIEKRNIMHIPILKDGQLVRMVSERHVRDAMPSILTLSDPTMRRKALALTRVSQVGIENPITVRPDTTVLNAISMMRRRKTGSLPVLKEGELVGIVTSGDLISFLEKILLSA